MTATSASAPPWSMAIFWKPPSISSWMKERSSPWIIATNGWTAQNNPRVAVTIDRLYPSEKEDDELHTTFGLGLTLGLKFQLDFAVDLSGLSDTASLSGVYRF